jgi:hypothetical protein
MTERFILTPLGRPYKRVFIKVTLINMNMYVFRFSGTLFVLD